MSAPGALSPSRCWRGSGAPNPRQRFGKCQPFQSPEEKSASRTRQSSNLAHNQSRLHHGEGSWYRPKQAMEMEPSGAGWAWRSDRGGGRDSEGPKVRRGRWRDSRVDGAGSFKPACSRISRSRRRPLPGDFDPARLRGNVDRDETSPQSPSLEKNGSAERSGLAETHTHYPRSSGLGPVRSAPPHQLSGFPREAARPCLQPRSRVTLVRAV
jgi:hypothetical protein